MVLFQFSSLAYRLSWKIKKNHGISQYQVSFKCACGEKDQFKSWLSSEHCIVLCFIQKVKD